MIRSHSKKKYQAEYPGLCTECEKYPDCREPCESVKKWIDQDKVPPNYKNVVLQVYPEKSVTNKFGNGNGVSCKKMNGYLDSIALGSPYGNEPPMLSLDEPDLKLLEDLRIPERHIETIRLIFVDGLTKAESARRLNISNQSIHLRLEYIKRNVSEMLLRRSFWYNSLESHEFDTLYDREICRLFFRDLLQKKEIRKSIGCCNKTVVNRITKYADLFGYSGNLGVTYRR